MICYILVNLSILGDQNQWWFPKSVANATSGMAIKETEDKWITDTISEADLRVAGIIANVSLVEIIIGNFNQPDII